MCGAEVVSTATCGRLVIYHVWWVDPKGNEVAPTKEWIPNKHKPQFREERSLLQSIVGKKMESVTRSAPSRSGINLRNLGAVGHA
jgi:hypothetical protein